MPDLSGMTMRQALVAGEEAGLRIIVEGTGQRRGAGAGRWAAGSTRARRPVVRFEPPVAIPSPIDQVEEAEWKRSR